VTTKKPKTGGEIDAYCTKCRLDLLHRIIAMVGDSVKKVECKTCGSHHLYRRPKSERDERLRMLESKRAAAGDPKPRGAGERRSTAAERLTAAQKVERDQTTAWEKAIAGQPPTAFKPYRITLTFSQGELVRHPKFGDGVVARVIDRGKAEILFKDGPRTMAHGQVLS
jgi:Zn ribbon nucleic-acid-binding protein